ncbi:MAG TPA: hypothetical protein VGS02_00935 [Acidobacteriaceae bacterium]|nr:hypothetical protein [Acidobacteriaceae bacterium]
MITNTEASLGIVLSSMLLPEAQRQVSREVFMQATMEEVLLTTRTIESRPEILSFDSGDECSLDHWFEVYWLVEEEFAFAREADAEQLGP